MDTMTLKARLAAWDEMAWLQPAAWSFIEAHKARLQKTLSETSLTVLPTISIDCLDTLTKVEKWLNISESGSNDGLITFAKDFCSEFQSIGNIISSLPPLAEAMNEIISEKNSGQHTFRALDKDDLDTLFNRQGVIAELLIDDDPDEDWVEANLSHALPTWDDRILIMG